MQTYISEIPHPREVDELIRIFTNQQMKKIKLVYFVFPYQKFANSIYAPFRFLVTESKKIENL